VIDKWMLRIALVLVILSQGMTLTQQVRPFSIRYSRAREAGWLPGDALWVAAMGTVPPLSRPRR